MFQKIKKLHRRKSTSPSAANDGQKRSRSCFPQSSPSFSFTTENNNNDSIPNGSKKNDVIKETVMRSSTPVLQKVHPKKSTSSGKGGTEKGNMLKKVGVEKFLMSNVGSNSEYDCYILNLSPQLEFRAHLYFQN